MAVRQKDFVEELPARSEEGWYTAVIAKAELGRQFFARNLLGRLGAMLQGDAFHLPFADAAFDLVINRHGAARPMGALWKSEYRGGPVFFWGKGLTFLNAASDLIYAAGQLARRITDLMRSVITLEDVSWSPVPRWVSRQQNIGDAVTAGLEFDARHRLDQLFDDGFDAGALLYEHIPLLGRGIRFIRERV